MVCMVPKCSATMRLFPVLLVEAPMSASVEAKKSLKTRPKKRAAVRRRPSRAKIARQCRAANIADKRDTTWQDLIHWLE